VHLALSLSTLSFYYLYHNQLALSGYALSGGFLLLSLELIDRGHLQTKHLGCCCLATLGLFAAQSAAIMLDIHQSLKEHDHGWS